MSIATLHAMQPATSALPMERSADVEAHERHEAARYAVIHQDVIRRFGRFPHRNPALGRETTAEEQAFLDGGGFAG